ncbi:Fibronectin type IIii domain protein [Ignavibacterium album JCM 16511]|uniref:Fibronectin type IIii domain protein n=1 Tax=Ignavibacterium album (strain DSM 19864 / JCM 16511 / NBRC 101810 / Mat9-16) TaxID=945713 RepID=I0AJ49_IGNAJ|nr:Fibronectin type IIii domain-containing protein [Ignavibacterium album]AFH49006.1 Fibronectin type IIii domain protein [Ignavibacterium album JCM 16511]
MKRFLYYSILIFISSTIWNACVVVKEVIDEEEFNLKATDFKENFPTFRKYFGIPLSGKVDSVFYDDTEKKIIFRFNKQFASIPLREDNVAAIKDSVKNFFGDEYSLYDFEFYIEKYPIDELIPNYFRSNRTEIDKARLPLPREKKNPIIKNISKPFQITNGLNEKNVLLWHSHGWYYNNQEKRWMWQRARLFQTVEDIGPLSFTIPFLIPMLENAGATVFVPRERDTQVNEVIIDNDTNKQPAYLESVTNKKLKWKSYETGFALKNKILTEGENPFLKGTSKYIETDTTETATIKWSPDIPETGEYTVYISYQSFEDSNDETIYFVSHAGGKTEFRVNQKIGGGTWIHLGKFLFRKGKDKNQFVMLSNKANSSGKIVSGDAIRFGGGMGIIEREGQISKRAKFIEGSRYWLQYAGMPDTLVYNLNKSADDYKDDYQSRAEYGNYLYGKPYGPNRNRNEKGLGIPIDVSLAFHTDAGITRNDTVIGTLMIYSTPGLDSLDVFPDGVSRLANRDLADIVQTQIVEDLRTLYDSAWTRRQLMDAMYSEAARPNFPSMLLELLSHQNFLDMKFHLDPRFKFDASRAIYKGILKFLAYQYNYEYVVQPLPVTHFAAELVNNKVKLSWQPKPDPLESTALPEKYIVYTRIDDGGFDNGRLIDSTSILIENLEAGKIYSFKVTALNKGGESFPSEILSVGISKKNTQPVLIVNGFDRVSPPASIESPKFMGFFNIIDEGIPYLYDYGYTGVQFNFDPDSKWETDDNPGHGASASDYETKIIAGNTFDFSYIHGKALLNNGFSFCSVSDESVWDGKLSLTKYPFVDFIFGEEKKTLPPKSNSPLGIEFQTIPDLLKEKIKTYIQLGGKMFMSGSYIGSDLYTDPDSVGVKFANEVLRVKLKTGYASRIGEVYSVNEKFLSKNFLVKFNTEFNEKIYKVEAPDEIGPINGSEILLRYNENEFSAAVGFREGRGVVVFGFPFETILDETKRNEVMKAVLDYLEVK